MINNSSEIDPIKLMVVDDEKDILRIIKRDLEANNNNTFEVFFTIFSYFHPRTRPVLWRVLITQVYLYNAIKNIRNSEEEFNISNFDEFMKLFEIQKIKSKCDWIQSHEEVSDEEFNIPFEAAENYLKMQLADVLELKQFKKNT